LGRHYQSINAQLKHSLAAHYGCKGTLILAFVGFMTILYSLVTYWDAYFTLHWAKKEQLKVENIVSDHRVLFWGLTEERMQVLQGFMKKEIK